MSKKITIVIPCFNGENYIAKCLASILDQKTTCEVQTIVVDNGSTDISLKIIRNNFPGVQIIENEKNLGFAKAVNIGIIEAMERGAEAVLLLNQDTVIPPSLIEVLNNSNSDIVAPVLSFQRNGKTICDYGGKVNFWTGRTTHVEMEEGQAVREPVDYVSFCCVLIQKSVFDKIGLLNEKYFLYFEDVDYCLRAKNKGLTVSVENDVVINHEITEHKAVKGELNEFKIKQHLNSQLTFINQNIKWWRKPVAYLYFYLLKIKIAMGNLKYND